MTTVLLQAADLETQRELILGAHPEIDLVQLDGDEPPSDLRAEVFFGGFWNWDTIMRWLDATGVQWVQLSGTGVDKVPVAIYTGRTVTCARGASAVPIAEWVLAAILARAKRFPEVFLQEPPRHWNFPDPALASVAGSTVGIVGLGGIGLAVAERALAFGMRVKALRRTDAASPIAGVEIVPDIETLVAGAEHLVLAAPATQRTRHLLDADVLTRVQTGVHIVNIARGALVDQDALRAALDDGRVGLATLDTVDPEPLPAGHWMYEHPAVQLSAHVSWYTPALQRTAVELFIENLGRYLRGEPLQHVVDPAEGY